MATKKYISPDVFPTTIRDNYRLATGAHYIIQSDGTISWNPSAKQLAYNPFDPLSPTPDVGEGLTFVNIPNENERRVSLRRGSNTSVSETMLQYGLNRSAASGLATLNVVVEGSSNDFGSLSSFASDVEFLFKNAPINALTGDDYYYDRTFQYTAPEQDAGEFGSHSEYNYLVEAYESITGGIDERILPNRYNINLLERVGDTATVSYDVSGLPDEVINTGAEGVSDVYSVTLDHTLLNGRIERSVIREQGLYSDNFFESEYLSLGISVEELLRSDLAKTLDTKYRNYYQTWPDNYVSLLQAEQFELQDVGTNVIFSSAGLDLFNSEYATETKLPFYSVISFLTETPPVYTDLLSVGQISPVSLEMSNSYLFSAFGSHIAGVYDPAYIDPRAGVSGRQYAFTGRSFIDQEGSGQISLMVSPQLHEYPAASIVDSYETRRSFNAALRYHSTYDDLVGGAVDPGPLPMYSPESTFATNKKMFVDVKLDSLGEVGKTDLALALSVAPDVDNPDPFERTSIEDFNLDVTQLSVPVGTGVDSSYGVGGYTGLTNQVNASFHTPRSGGSVHGRLYQESFEDGKSALNETVMYRVAKYRGTNTSVQPIQNFWIPAVSTDAAAKTIEYIDSQVRYGQQYTYEVTALKYVFGMKYRYEQVSAPEPSVVETVLDTEGTTIGYIVTWTGFENLFEDWETAISLIASSNNPPWATYASLFDPTYVYTAGDYVHDAPGFRYENKYFLSIDRLNELLEASWNLTPASGFDYEVIHTNKSWKQLFGLDWDDSYKVRPNTRLGGGLGASLAGGSGTTFRDLITSDSNASAQFGTLLANDPTNFSVDDWLSLWFGAGISTEEYEPSSGGRRQWLPPSHHLLPSMLPDLGNLGVDSAIPSDARLRNLTGFEGYFSQVLDAPTFTIRVYTKHTIETIEPGAGLTSVELSGYKATYQVQMSPTVEIVEVPYFTTTTSVLSKPPPPPEITIVPYRGVNDTLLFTLSATNIKTNQVPIPLEEGDQEMLDMHRIAQDKFEGQAIEFSQDDVPSFFQIFRLDKAPSKYTDFAGSLRNTISTRIKSKEDIIRTTSVSYDEKLQPNVKYYYTFRVVDYHGNFSNPTTVYEVELVDDAGAVYVLIKPYEFPIISNDQPTVDMKKFIQIIPTLEQVTADVPSNTNFADPSDIGANDVQLGSDTISEEDRIWDKKFKIRLTSKKTGKKIDINVTFDKEDKRDVVLPF